MSTILKALRRLEREKSSLAGRPLQDEIAAAAPLPSRRRLPIAAIGAALAALGLGLGAAMFWRGSHENAAPELAVAPSARPSAAVAQDVPSAAVTQGVPDTALTQSVPDALPAPPVLEAPTPAAPVASAPPPAAFASPVAVIERPEPPAVAEPAPAVPGEGAAATEAPSERAPAPGELPPFVARSRAAQQPPTPPAPVPVSRPKEIARAATPAPAARSLDGARSEALAATPSPAPLPAPVARRKPAPEKVVRANLPDVFVSSTVWHPQKDRRLAKVTLAGGAAQELHEGDALGPLVVSLIEPSGVVFVHDGVEIRRRVGAKY